jgi:hypothetical protein
MVAAVLIGRSVLLYEDLAQVVNWHRQTRAMKKERPDVQAPVGQKRTKIVHDFAKWTALSALRSGSPLKSGKRVYDLIERHADLTALFSLNRGIDEAEFDHWHEDTILAFCKAEHVLPVGWAAKIVNVYLKTRVYLAGEGREGLVKAIHPPIDTSLQEGLKRRFPQRPWRKMTIPSIQSYQDDYMPFVNECRSLAREEGCLPIELEWYYPGNKDTHKPSGIAPDFPAIPGRCCESL